MTSQPPSPDLPQTLLKRARRGVTPALGQLLELYRNTLRLLAHLPADYRKVIVLRNLERRPFEAIARQLHRSPRAVCMLWTWALEKLSRLMEAPS